MNKILLALVAVSLSLSALCLVQLSNVGTQMENLSTQNNALKQSLAESEQQIKQLNNRLMQIPNSTTLVADRASKKSKLLVDEKATRVVNKERPQHGVLMY